jgi:hypothetical protein
LAQTLLRALAKKGTVSKRIPGTKKPIVSDVAWAVHATTHFNMKAKIIFATPTWPITTLAGCIERTLAAVINVGPRKELPRPASENPMQITRKLYLDW